jgi:hypothetical protein
MVWLAVMNSRQACCSPAVSHRVSEVLTMPGYPKWLSV